MIKLKQTIQVTIDETKLANHTADNFEVANGHLMIYRDEELIASYTPGNWKSVKKFLEDESNVRA